MLLASLMFPAKVASATPEISILPATVQGNPGDYFNVTINIANFVDLSSWEVIIRVDPRVLQPQRAIELPLMKGAWIPFPTPHWQYLTEFKWYRTTGGEYIQVGCAIKTMNGKVTGSGGAAIVEFKVVGGGETDLAISGAGDTKLLKVDLTPITHTTVDGYFWSPYPFAGFTWWVPTRQSDGVTIVNTEMGAMLFDDLLTLDASSSYDVDGSIVSYSWLIKWGDEFVFKGIPCTITLSGETVPYTFEWPLPPGTWYHWMLGFAKLYLTVTDNSGKSSTFSTWIRILPHGGMSLAVISRGLSPTGARPINVYIPNRGHHSLSADGATTTLSGKIKNTVCTGIGGQLGLPFDYFASWMELNRIASGNFWAKMQFRVRDALTGKWIGDPFLSGNTQFIGPEEETGFLSAQWTIPGKGVYLVYGYGTSSGSGYQFLSRNPYFVAVKSLTVTD